MKFLQTIESLTRSRAMREGNFDSALEEILVKSSEAIGVERANAWLINEDFTQLSCIGAFEKKKNKFTKGVVLESKDYPHYFEKIKTAERLVSEDAVSAAYNKELLDSYILPLGISSMMDIPIRIEGKMIGMVCFEHVGPKRTWTTMEESFALSVAQIISLAFETSMKNDYRMKLEVSLREKEVLLSEINHRVKNNLAIISSLMNLQKEKAKDEYHKILFDDSKDKIYSMAFIHEQLYRSKNYTKIDFGSYLEQLIEHLHSSHSDGKKIIVMKDIDHLDLNITKAIPVGLITNEIITNAYKYAFSENRDGVLEISFKKDNNGSYILHLADNGPGIEANEARTDSFGIILVKDLIEQIDGDLNMYNEHGAVYDIKFRN
jgi:two-component sensor histidine kinase